jgi:tRNA (guanosine-2'-O-)-methyltransferase
MLTPKRVKRIQEVVGGRTPNLTMVLERLYDLGNISAIIRTAENLGLMDMHIIESTETKYSSRTTQGAHKWITKHKWDNTLTCMKKLKAEGFQIVATGLSAEAIPLNELDLSIPTAIIVGNEKDGVSTEAMEFADVNCVIPTTGFSQSFNVSIAAAIMLSYAFFKRDSGHSSLSAEERMFLEAEYMLRTYKSPHLLYERLKAKPVK